MIYCPKCGAANREGSRFCNECGEKLGTQTRLKCPHCGALNPVQNVFCDECGDRLLSSPGAEVPPRVKGLSLPTIPHIGEEQDAASDIGDTTSGDDTPSWLQELGSTMSAVPEADLASAQDSDDGPDWLQDLRSSLPEEPGGQEPPGSADEIDAAPDWLSELRPSTSESELADLTPAPQIEEEQPDWLADLRGPTATEEAVPEPIADEGEVPDWLSDLQTPAPAEEPMAAVPAPDAEAGEVPDWLTELQPPAPAEEPVAAAQDTKEGQVPDWLSELQPPTPVEEPVVAEPAPDAEEGEVPDWLSELQPPARAEEPVVAAPAPDAEEGEVPDWLSELQPPARAEEPVAAAPTPDAEEGEVPDWLSELQPPAPVEEPVVAAPAPDAEEGEVPDWPAEPQPPAPAEEPMTAPIPAAEEGEVPDWLAELQSSAPAEEPMAAAPIPAAEESEVPDWLAGVGAAAAAAAVGDKKDPASQETPDWLEEVATAGPEVAAPAKEPLADAELPDWLVPSEGDLEGADDSLARADIPEWLLSLKPRELGEEVDEEIKAPTPISEEAVEETGLLAGLQGTLPVELLIATPRAATAPELEFPEPVDGSHSQLFADIVARPPSIAPKAIVQPKRHALAKVPRLVIYLVLIVAVVVPLLLTKSPVPRTIVANGAVTGMYTAIEQLSPGDRALVAFDYDPTTSGEMDVVAQSIVNHLANQEAGIVLVSLLPAGPAMAERIMAQTEPQAEYTNLGYLPGQATAVRLIHQSLETASPTDYQGDPLADSPLLNDIEGLGDFALIIELAATQDSLRWWIEQAGQPSGTSLGAGVSASVEPLARSYYETTERQLVGVVGGVPGAAMYESQRTSPGILPQGLAARLDAQLAGHIVLILVLLVGNVIYMVRRSTGEKQ